MVSYAAKSDKSQLCLSAFDRSDLFREEVKHKKVVQCPRCRKHPEVEYLGVWLCEECWHRRCEEK